MDAVQGGDISGQLPGHPQTIRQPPRVRPRDNDENQRKLRAEVDESDIGKKLAPAARRPLSAVRCPPPAVRRQPSVRLALDRRLEQSPIAACLEAAAGRPRPRVG